MLELLSWIRPKSRNRWRRFASERNLPTACLQQLTPTRLYYYRMKQNRFNLVFPGAILLSEDEDDIGTMQMCGNDFVPFGSCGNGDLIAMSVADDGTLKIGEIYFLALELFAAVQQRSDYTRLVAKSLADFFENIETLPYDCYEETQEDAGEPLTFNSRTPKGG